MTDKDYAEILKGLAVPIHAEPAMDRAIDLLGQEPKTGHWIDDTKYGGNECSECGKWYPHATIAKNEIKYCSKCGAKMVEQESEEV